MVQGEGPVSGTSGQGGAFLSYKTAVFPVTISLGGTTPDSNGNPNILIGQGCTASLVITPPPFGQQFPGTLSNYHWDPGGNVFDQFQVASDQSWGHASFPAPDVYEQPNPMWRYLQDSGTGTVSVSCTATVSINGTAIGTVTGQKPLTVWAPYYYFGNDTGGVFIDPATTAGTWSLHAAGIPHTSPRGINWQGRVLTPALFSSNGYGLWQFVQIVSPGRSKTLVGGGSDNCSENGARGLDTVYPYDPVGGTDGPNGGWVCDDTPQVSGDNPSTGLDDTIASANVDESFETYMLYHPPGNSEWVPLHKFQWHWYTNDSIPGISWTSWVAGSSAGYVARSSSQRCYDHPFWQKLENVHVGSGW